MYAKFTVYFKRLIYAQLIPCQMYFLLLVICRWIEIHRFLQSLTLRLKGYSFHQSAMMAGNLQ